LPSFTEIPPRSTRQVLWPAGQLKNVSLSSPVGGRR